MARWEGNEVRVELPRVVEVHVGIVGGEVAVTAGSGPPRVDAHVVHGDPLRVDLEGGVLTVVHEPERWLSGLSTGISIGGLSLGGRTNRQEAVVTVSVPPETPVTIRTISGDAVIAGLRLGASVTTVSGRITATDVAGEIGLRSVSGDIEAESVDGPVSTNVVSGQVTVTGRVPDLSGHSVSGELTFDLDIVPEVSLSTVSGDVFLRLPADASLRLNLSTMSGSLDSAFPVEGSQSRRRLSGDVGHASGAPSVSVRTMSGDVAVLRKERSSASAGASGNGR